MIYLLKPLGEYLLLCRLFKEPWHTCECPKVTIFEHVPYYLFVAFNIDFFFPCLIVIWLFLRLLSLLSLNIYLPLVSSSLLQQNIWIPLWCIHVDLSFCYLLLCVKCIPVRYLLHLFVPSLFYQFSILLVHYPRHYLASIYSRPWKLGCKHCFLTMVWCQLFARGKCVVSAHRVFGVRCCQEGSIECFEVRLVVTGYS